MHQYFLCRCRLSGRQMFWGLHGSLFTRVVTPYLCHAIWFLFALVNKIMVIFSVSAKAAKERPALQPLLFFWWESCDVTLVVLRERSRPPSCLPASLFVSARSHHYSPAGLLTEYYSFCISDNRPPWRRLDLESTLVQSQVFLL